MTHTSESQRFTRASWANVLGNVVKITVEGITGLAFGSVALVADAAHSVGDLVGSIVVLIWGDSRFIAADADHPHGHARIEPLTALFVGGVIVLLGLYLLFESVSGLRSGTEIEFSIMLVAALLFAMGDMGAVYWYTIQMNRTIDSPALNALAIDCRNDLFTTVAALTGVLGVAAGVPVLDPLAGGFVSLFVVYQGATIAVENLGYLSGRAAPVERREAVRKVLLAHDTVAGVHDLAVFYDGPQLEVEAHVEVTGDMTLQEAHEIESELLSNVTELHDVDDVHLHLDPEGLGEWKDATV